MPRTLDAPHQDFLPEAEATQKGKEVHLAELARGVVGTDERPLREAELFDLDEAFITSTTQAVMPVTEVDGRVIANSRRGEITERLQHLLDEAELHDVADEAKGSAPR